MSFKLTADCMRYAPWSNSKAKMALNCPWQFRKKYVERVKGVEPPATSRRKVGLAAHETVEAMLKRPDVPIDNILRIQEGKHDLTSAETDELRLYKSQILEFGERIRKFVAAKGAETKSPLLVELRMAITPDFEPCEFFNNDGLFRGVIDLGIPTHGGNLVVIDHKARAKGRMEWYLEQLRGYQILGVYGLKVPDFNILAVQPAVHYILDGTIDWIPVMMRREISIRMRNWLIEFLNKAGAFGNKNDQWTGKHCDWCGYTEACEAFTAMQTSSGGSDGKAAATTEVNI